MANKYKEIKKIVEEIEHDIERFYEKSNKTAGIRIRKAMQDLKKLAQELRTEVQDIKKKM